MGEESPRGIGLLAVSSRGSVHWSAACLLALGLAACANTPAEDDATQAKLNDVDARLAHIEKVVSSQSLLDLSNQIESLKADLRAMHNDVDILSNNLDAARKQQKSLYADLDQRMKVLEARSGVGSGAAIAPAAGESAAGIAASRDAAGSGSDDKAAYQAAFALLKDGQYDRAIAAFQKFLTTYPDSQMADNAQYWLGEGYYVNKAYPDAQSAFQRVVDKYPQSRKIPDALLKIGYCQYESKQYDAAKEVLSQVVASYPDTPAGHLAQQRLAKMAAESN
jgi:tol-pal system protein YbgF